MLWGVARQCGLCCCGAARRVVSAVSCAGFPVHCPTNAVFSSLSRQWPPSQTLAGLVSFAEKPRHGPEGGIETPAQRYVSRVWGATRASSVAESTDSAAQSSSAVLVAVTEIRKSGAYDCAGCLAIDQRSFRCKGSVDIVLHTELAGTTE